MPLAAPYPALEASLALRRRLRETESHMRQMVPQLVQGADGVLYQVMGGLGTGQIATGRYPFQGARSMLPPLGEDAAHFDFLNAASLSALETRLHRHSLHSLMDSTGQQVQARALPVAISPVHPFQIIWVGGDQPWHVAAGTVTSGGYFDPDTNQLDPTVTHSFPALRLAGDKGWIGLPLRLLPAALSWFQQGHVPQRYTVDALGPVVFKSNPRHSPATRTVAVPNEESGSAGSVGWTAGEYFIPLAYVQAPHQGRVTPIIRRCVGDYLRLSTGWQGSLHYTSTLTP